MTLSPIRLTISTNGFILVTFTLLLTAAFTRLIIINVKSS